MRGINEIGNKYGRLVVLSEDGRAKNNSIKWRCACRCGKEISVPGTSLRANRINSCGCCSKEATSVRNRSRSTHGLCNHYLYKTFRGMIERCCNPKAINYDNYGGRGIKIHPSWKEPKGFITWIENNLGKRPEGFTLDRVDPNGNYEPGNIRWSSVGDQNKNQRTRRRLHLLSTEEEELIADFRKKKKRVVRNE